MSTIFKNNRFFPQNFLLLSDSGIGLDNQITEICQEAFRVSPGSFNGEANKPFFPNKKPHAEVPAARKRTTCKNKKDKLHSILSKTQIRIFRQYHATVIGNTVQL